jgi:hypothetical protein
MDKAKEFINYWVQDISRWLTCWILLIFSQKYSLSIVDACAIATARGLGINALFKTKN